MKPSLYIEKILTDTLGLELASMGKGFLERTLEGLLKKSGCPSLEDYVTSLKASPEEREKIIEAVVVPETWFFRDHGPFAYLKNYLLEAGQRKNPKEKMRILSVPCSTGEEPYSIVMTLLEAGLTPEEFVVDAVDLSENALRIAREGRYGKGSFRGVTGKMGSSYFHPEGSEFKLSEQVVSGVRFYCDNLLSPASMAQRQAYQVIFCRNLLIYLHTKAKEVAFSHIDRLLRPGGVLIAGHAEVLFWRQRGYLLVDHPRSFALIKPTGKEERSSVPSPLPLTRKEEARPEREAERRGSPETVGIPRAVNAPAEDFQNHDYARPLKNALFCHSGLDKPAPASSKPGESSNESKVLDSGFRRNDDREPEREFFKTLDASPTDALIQARSLADRGKVEEALSLCQSCLAKEQPCAELYYLMGLIHESRERIGEAEECYRKALYLDPDHFETLIHAGLMYERRGDREKAALLKKRMTRIEGQRQPHPHPGPPLERNGHTR